MPQALKPLSLIHIGKGKFSQLSLLALWGNKNWPPQYEMDIVENFPEQNWLKGLQMKAPGTENLLSYEFFEDSKLSLFNFNLSSKARPPEFDYWSLRGC